MAVRIVAGLPRGGEISQILVTNWIPPLDLEARPQGADRPRSRPA
jgi:hypothetical protein